MPHDVIVVSLAGKVLVPSLSLEPSVCVGSLGAQASEALGGRPCVLLLREQELSQESTLEECGVHDGDCLTAVVVADLLVGDKVLFKLQGRDPQFAEVASFAAGQVEVTLGSSSTRVYPRYVRKVASVGERMPHYRECLDAKFELRLQEVQESVGVCIAGDRCSIKGSALMYYSASKADLRAGGYRMAGHPESSTAEVLEDASPDDYGLPYVLVRITGGEVFVNQELWVEPEALEVLAKGPVEVAIGEAAIAGRAVVETATAEPAVAEAALAEPASAEALATEPNIAEAAVAEPAVAEAAVAEATVAGASATDSAT